MTDPAREGLRRRGDEVLARLQHGTNPPRDRPLHLGSVPGLATYTSEALWGSVWTRPGLDFGTRVLATLAILASLQRIRQLRTYLHSALNIGVPVDQIEEVFVQCSVHTGFPTTVNTLELLREVLEVRGDVPIREPERPADDAEESLADLERRGRELRRLLFAEPADPADPAGQAGAPGPEVVPTPAEALAQLSDRYVFGSLYNRGALDLRARVVCTIASLVAIRDTDELGRWLSAGLRVGVTAESMSETILHAAYYVGFPTASQAMAVADRVLS